MHCRHHFWFLEVMLAGGRVSLQQLCGGIFLAFLPALLVPGLVATASLMQLVGPLLIFQVCPSAGSPELFCLMQSPYIPIGAATACPVAPTCPAAVWPVGQHDDSAAS